MSNKSVHEQLQYKQLQVIRVYNLLFCKIYYVKKVTRSMSWIFLDVPTELGNSYLQPII